MLNFFWSRNLLTISSELKMVISGGKDNTTNNTTNGFFIYPWHFPW